MPASAFTMDFDASDIIEQLDQLVDDARTLIRPAAQAGAEVYYQEVRSRVPVATKTVKMKSGFEIHPGALRAAIYQAFSADNSGPARATYHVSWNAQKVPHGYWVENGHWTRTVGKYGPLKPKWVPGVGFIRRSFDSASDRALNAVSAKLDEGLSQVLARMST